MVASKRICAAPAFAVEPGIGQPGFPERPTKRPLEAPGPNGSAERSTRLPRRNLRGETSAAYRLPRGPLDRSGQAPRDPLAPVSDSSRSPSTLSNRAFPLPDPQSEPFPTETPPPNLPPASAERPASPDSILLLPLSTSSPGRHRGRPDSVSARAHSVRPTWVARSAGPDISPFANPERDRSADSRRTGPTAQGQPLPTSGWQPRDFIDT